MRRYIGALVCVGGVMLLTLGAAMPEPRDGPEAVAALTLQHGRALNIHLSDEVRIILVGTALIGAASLVRHYS